jgi:hypothetical protein
MAVSVRWDSEAGEAFAYPDEPGAPVLALKPNEKATWGSFGPANEAAKRAGCAQRAYLAAAKEEVRGAAPIEVLDPFGAFGIVADRVKAQKRAAAESKRIAEAAVHRLRLPAADAAAGVQAAAADEAAYEPAFPESGPAPCYSHHEHDFQLALSDRPDHAAELVGVFAESKTVNRMEDPRARDKALANLAARLAAPPFGAVLSSIEAEAEDSECLHPDALYWFRSLHVWPTPADGREAGLIRAAKRQLKADAAAEAPAQSVAAQPADPREARRAEILADAAKRKALKKSPAALEDALQIEAAYREALSAQSELGQPGLSAEDRRDVEEDLRKVKADLADVHFLEAAEQAQVDFLRGLKLLPKRLSRKGAQDA